MTAFEDRIGVPSGSTASSLAGVREGRVAWVVLSGKMCSGKDTLASRLELPGEKEYIAYGTMLRDNLSLALDYWPLFETEEEKVADLAKVLGYSTESAAELSLSLHREVERHGSVQPWNRTDGMRTILQKMGSEWLPDADYLPRTAALQALQHFDRGNSVVAPGSRFLPDVEIPVLGGAITVRLDVSRETQLRRLHARDGLAPTEELLEALDHPGESALDDYPHDVRISNDDDSPGALETVVAEVNEAVHRILESRRV